MKDTLTPTNNISPWLENLPLEWDQIIRYGTRLKLKKQEIIFHQYDTAHYIYIVADGRVRLFLNSLSGEEKALSIIGKNGLIGECGFFEPHNYITCAITASQTLLYRIPRGDFAQLVKENQQLMEQLVYLVNYKYRLLCTQTLQLSYSKALNRVCEALVHLATNYGEQISETEIKISINFTHQELANLVGTTRITVIKTLKYLEQHQIVVRKNKFYYIQDYQTLLDLIEEE